MCEWSVFVRGCTHGMDDRSRNWGELSVATLTAEDNIPVIFGHQRHSRGTLRSQLGSKRVPSSETFTATSGALPTLRMNG